MARGRSSSISRTRTKLSASTPKPTRSLPHGLQAATRPPAWPSTLTAPASSRSATARRWQWLIPTPANCSPPPPSATVPTPRDGTPTRSEEHTSELRSLRHLVCRLLLAKKKDAVIVLVPIVYAETRILHLVLAHQL